MTQLDWHPCAQHAASWQDATVPEDACTTYLRSVGFDPQPKQYDFITCPADDVGFGGARGGAKSYAILGDWLWHDKEYGESAIGIVFRRERVQLMEFIERAKIIFAATGDKKWKWHSLDKYFESPNGSRLRFAYLDKESDADGYQGHEYTRVYVEERGTFPREGTLNKLQATLRSGRGVPCQMKSTFNPGGVGHQHIKQAYRLFDKIPKGYEVITTPEGITRVFIPSKLPDNKYLGESYIRTLRAACAGNDALLNAWLDGDWSIVEGAFFHSWGNGHVIPDFPIPSDWLRFRSMCWGAAKPLSVGWWAVARSDFSSDDAQVPRGSLVRYREWYATKARGTNEGVKLTAEQIADQIKMREPGEPILYGVATPQIFISKGGPSIAERMGRHGIWFRPGDDAKAAKMGHLSGWDAVRQRLVGGETGPAIFCFNSCADSVRTIPALQHDRDDPEDIDGESEAAAAHDWRFACMSRPWQAEKKSVIAPKFLTVGGTSTVTMNDLWKARDKRKSERF